MIVPLLVESRAYVDRLSKAVERQGGCYALRRRINWSHRYESEFFAAECERFLQDPPTYLEGRVAEPPPALGDVYARTLGARPLAIVLGKVALHWAFSAFGALRLRRAPRRGAETFRKAYVDDIELVFDPHASGTIRGVFPFPLSASRQWRYLARARRESLPFALCGHRYGLRDLLRLLLHRDVRALMRLEVRAQLRTARWLVRAGFQKFELSDEFDLGSLDFCRALRRYRRSVVNSAHGVGKYLPWHAYQEFRVLTKRQAEYYRAVCTCRYVQRKLNSLPPVEASGAAGADVVLVWLSQVYSLDAQFIVDEESRVVAVLAAAFATRPEIKLLYKPHPNCNGLPPPAGFERLAALADVNGRPETVFASFYSTCQIDPAFVGAKVLVRTALIHPEIAFDASEPIMDANQLIELLQARRRATQ